MGRAFRVGFQTSPPYHFPNSEGRPSGPAVALVQTAADQADIRLEWVFSPKGPEESLRNGSVDLWPLMADLPERHKFGAHICRSERRGGNRGQGLQRRSGCRLSLGERHRGIHGLRVSQPLSVIDTGIGIPDKVKTLFQKFTQVDFHHETLRGTGLGLAISKQLVETMGGGISVTSRPGEGSSFTFLLPLERDGQSRLRTLLSPCFAGYEP
jgi:hypothetical protein